MTKALRILKLLACIFGGAVGASMILVLIGFLSFGFRGGDHLIQFIAKWNLVAGVAGAIVGGTVLLRSRT